MTETEAFILVGGLSRRFGSDKALADLGGESLLERTVKTVRTALTPQRVTLVAANEEQFSATLMMFGDLPFIFDLYQGRGPWGGLHAALAYSQAEWAFVIACDLPLVSADLLTRLAGFIRNDIDAVIPTQADGRLQPLCAFYCRKSCLAAVEDILSLDRPAPPLYTIAEEMETRIVQFGEINDLPGAENFFLNANRPEDIELAFKIASEALDIES
jgi:molybdopterin-guanine dinucleotide biosynthesis protein A